MLDYNYQELKVGDIVKPASQEDADDFNCSMNCTFRIIKISPSYFFIQNENTIRTTQITSGGWLKYRFVPANGNKQESVRRQIELKLKEIEDVKLNLQDLLGQLKFLQKELQKNCESN